MKKNDKQETSLREKKEAPQNLDLDDLNQVQGGSIGDVVYTPTVDLSDNTQSQI